MSRIAVVRRGRCATCGRNVPGIFKDGSQRECEGECPRCGCSPFYLDSVAPWTDNIAKMSEEDALALACKLEDEAEIEVLFRVEFLGPNRDSVLNALHKQYWKVHDVPPSATSRGRALTLEELRKAWADELSNPDSRRMYEELSRAS